MQVDRRVLIIACGAVAREVAQLIRVNEWPRVDVASLPAQLHNTPSKILDAMRREIDRSRSGYDVIFAAYADCGTGGRLDRLLAEYGIERLPGAHCYEFLTGSVAFQALSAREPGTFYLTDFLVRHFDRLVYRGLGLDRHPELKERYFGNYRRLVYLAQTDDPELVRRAVAHADRLGLPYERHYTGIGQLHRHIGAAIHQVTPCQSS